MASSTKEMGPGSREDHLDDAFGDHNWLKITKLPGVLLGKIKKAVVQRDLHATMFKQYSEALPIDAVTRWTAEVEAWEEDSAQPNPFLVTRPNISENAIRKKLLEEDAEALRLGKDPILHEEFSTSTMISAGIDLEDRQREHAAELAGLHTHATDNARAKLLERENILYRKLDGWFKIQQLFLPGVHARRVQLMSTATTKQPHKIPLLLPSTAFQYLDCPLKLLDQEWELRHGQAHDALATIRTHLELRCHLYKIKDRWVRGQGMQTRAMNSIAAVQYKIDMAAARYRAAYNALSALSPRLRKDRDGWRALLRPLQDGDLRHISEDPEGTEGTRTVSWLWMACPSAEDAANAGAKAEDSLQESLRVEWCKARARSHRWREEVQLLLEEMRRVPQFHEWTAQEWERRSDQNFQGREEYLEGARAYALQQASIRRKMKNFCLHVWRYVGVWVTLGETAGSALLEDELAPEPDPDVLPDLDNLSLTDTAPEAAANLAEVASLAPSSIVNAMSIASRSSDALPDLATLPSSSVADTASLALRSSDILPDLATLASSSQDTASVRSRDSDSLPPLV
ncbi:hypothetical protein K466DRAFT_603993 [Polyporus arcularius HHB13444]|uniref:Uncharacterized protein n=1 Tax=Polyporus arcularius HHB13444 TaxID=1314778 RepID=A0A5C3P8C0_9APHY|nr:hypothetical protein K466DRAFT_603993 [Polyporus arcularius HHB13444]